VSQPESAVAVVTICKRVCERHGVTLDDLFSERKWQPLAQARQEAMRLIRDVTDLSYPQIGRIFDRDHTTVMHACRVEEARDGWRSPDALLHRVLLSGGAHRGLLADIEAYLGTPQPDGRPA
jgi:hypothetical protein